MRTRSSKPIQIALKWAIKWRYRAVRLNRLVNLNQAQELSRAQQYNQQFSRHLTQTHQNSCWENYRRSLIPVAGVPERCRPEQEISVGCLMVRIKWPASSVLSTGSWRNWTLL